MKILFLFFFLNISFFSFSQETYIKWEDRKGRIHQISAPNGHLNFGMISGDKIDYASEYSDNAGKVIKVGDLYIEYSSKYSDFPGKVIKVGEVRLEYGGKYSDNPGKLLKVGGLRINYTSRYSDNPGMISSIQGKVLSEW